MKIKKLLSLLLVLTMVFSLAACGSKDAKDDTKSNEGTNNTATEAPKEETTEDEAPADITTAAFPTIDTLTLGEDFTDIKS